MGFVSTMYSICFIFVFSAFFSFSIFSLLRQKFYFNLFLGISIFLTIIFMFQMDFSKKKDFIDLHFIFSPIIFLYFYKLLDNHYIKKHKRHLIFAPKYSWFSEEGKNQTFTEILYQMIFFMFPFLTFNI